MGVWEALIQGIIQGLTEFLPISSSGHLALVQYFTGWGGEEGLLFTILLHLGTLLAVVLAFWKTISGLIIECGSILFDIVRGKFRFYDMQPRRRMVFLLFVSLLPMAGSYFLLGFFDRVATDDDIIVEGVCFLATSMLLFLSCRCVKGRKNAKSMKYSDALVIGAAQAIAPMPGLSRSGATISVGLMAGLEREYAVAFSFIMGVITVLGANVLKIREAVTAGFTLPLPAVIIGMVVALIAGLLAIKLMRWLVLSDKFEFFAWYTLVLGTVTVILGVVEQFGGHPLRGMIMGLASGS